MNRRKFLLLSLLLQLAPTLWLCRDFVFEGRYLLSGEALDMSLPWARNLDRIGWDVSEALWDRNSFCGIPFLANPAARTFYPPDLVFRLLTPLSPEASFSTLIFSHFLLLGFGGVLWARTFVRNLWSVNLAGWVFILNGYVVSRVGLADPNFLFAITWIPWILACLARLDQPRARFGLFLVGTCEVLAGRPDITFFTTYLVAAQLLVVWLPRLFRQAGRARAIGHFVKLALVALAVGLATAVQTLPTAEIQNHALNRSGESNYEFAVTDSLTPALFLATFFPRSLGDPNGVNPDPRTGGEGNFWGQGAGFHEIYFYMGHGILLLAVAGAFAGRTRMRYFWSAVALLAVALSMGRHLPFYRLVLEFVPGWDRFRVPPRVLVITLPAFAYLAAYGFETLVSRARCLPRTLRAVQFAAGFWGILIVGALLSWAFAGRWLETKFVGVGLSEARALESSLRAFWSAIFSAGGCGLAAALLFLVSASRPAWRNMRWALLALALGDLVWTNGSFLRSISAGDLAREFPKDPLIERYKAEMADGRLMILGDTQYFDRRPAHPWLFPGRVLDYGVEMVNGYGPFLLADHVNAFLRIDPTEKSYNGGLLLYYFNLDKRDPGLFGLFQVSAVLSSDRPVKGLQVLAVETYSHPVFGETRVFLSRNPSFYPRAFLFRPAPGQTPAPEGSLGKVTVKAVGATRVEIEVEAKLDCSLALLETHFRGWNCRVNQTRAPIEKLAGTFRSVRVPPGASQVIFEYQPTPFRIGVLLAPFGLLLGFVSAFPTKSRTSQAHSILA
ncbi:MAG: hypothetical protein HUU16_00415 [Candidatus Omnitrophica bacterium]|nr:hypothetical protein [bacterium]NUN94612.1 hypothetical protein [Candidatus Omnitrophota bacterium]